MRLRPLSTEQAAQAPHRGLRPVSRHGAAV